MDFQYRVRDPLGNIVQGKLEAISVDDATQQLRRDGFAVLELDEDSGGGLLPAASASATSSTSPTSWP